MVHVDDATLARLKNNVAQDALAMTPWERERAGQMFRIQLPIVDRATLKEHANLLRGLAAEMETAASMHHMRDFKLVSIIKFAVQGVNISARASILRAADQSRGSDATQDMDDQEL